MLTELLQNKILILDGAMGTVLQQRGLPPGGQPELLESIHREYISAGSRVIYTNTFGANGLKLAKSGLRVEETVAAAVAIAKRAAAGTDAQVALDIGPLGELLEPMGTLPFERAYELFRETVLAGVNAGADLIVIETMTDLYETKAALLAAKENSDLPVFVTMSFEASGRTFTGCTVASMARTLEGLERDEAEELAVSVSTAIAGEIAPYTDGLYLMTPFRRVALMERIILSIGESDLSVSAASRF